MPTMAEQAGLQPLTMAEAAGLAPVPPQSSAEQPIGPTLENAKNLPQLPLNFWDRYKQGLKDIGQGLVQRGRQLEDWLGAPHELMVPDQTKPPLPNGLLPLVHAHRPSAAEYTNEINQQRAYYEQRLKAQGGGINVPYFGNVDIPRAAGSITATVPAALVGPEGSLAAAGALQGGALGFSQFDPTNSFGSVARNTLIGAGSGAVLAPTLGWVGNKAAGGISNLVDRWKGFERGVPTVDDVSKLPGFTDLPISQQNRILQDAQEQMARTGNIDPASLARKSNIIANGGTPTQSMVTRNAGDWAQERNLAKTLQQSPNPALRAQGEKLNNVFVTNDQAFGSRLRSLSEDLPTGTSEAYGNTAMGVINDIQRSSQRQVGDLYRQIRNSVGDEVGAKPNTLLDTINELSLSPAADPIVDATHRFMVKKGILTRAEDGSLQPEGTMSVSQAEGLRQHITAQPNAFGKAQLINALDRDVLDTVGGDAFASARGAARARFEALDNPAVQRVLSTYGELQQGRTAQNFIQQHVIGAPVQDLDAMSGTVRTLGTPEQQSLFQQALEGGIMKHLEDRAINPVTGQFSGTALHKAVTEIGNDRLGLFMRPDRLEKLDSLRQAAVDATVQPAHSAVNASNSGATVLGMGHPNFAGPGIKALLPDITHEFLPSAVLNAPQNIAAKQAVNHALRARGMPPGTAPNDLTMRIARMLGTGAGATAAEQATLSRRPTGEP